MVENPKGQSRQKIGAKTMGMAKIPQRASWEKITWHGKKKKKMMKISKDNKWVVLSLLKLKDDKLFLWGMWNLPTLY